MSRSFAFPRHRQLLCSAIARDVHDDDAAVYMLAPLLPPKGGDARVPASVYQTAFEHDRMGILRWLSQERPDTGRQEALINEAIDRGRRDTVRTLYERAGFTISNHAFARAALSRGGRRRSRGGGNDEEEFLAWMVRANGNRHSGSGVPMGLAIEHFSLKTLQALRSEGYVWQSVSIPALIFADRLDLLRWMHDEDQGQSQGQGIPQLLKRDFPHEAQEDCVAYALVTANDADMLEWLYETARVILPATFSVKDADIKDPRCREFWDEYGGLWVSGTYVPCSCGWDIKPAKRSASAINE